MRALIRVERIAEVIAAMPVDHADWLSASELARLATLKVAHRRDQFLAGHWLVRSVLATRFGGDARDWSLAQRPNKPPAIVGHETTKQLSLSHSGDWIAAGVSVHAIGIDLEQRRVRDALHRFEELLLAEGEIAGTLDNDALLQRWVIKEALIKRDHGAALPEQLAALKIAPVDAESAPVQLLSTAQFHFGVAIAANHDFELISDQAVLARSGWKATN